MKKCSLHSTTIMTNLIKPLVLGPETDVRGQFLGPETDTLFTINIGLYKIRQPLCIKYQKYISQISTKISAQAD